MLKIHVPKTECFDEETSSFVEIKSQDLALEHSLVSVSKWEATWKKPFLSKTEKTFEETIDYIRCMTTTQNVDPIVYNFLDNTTITKINSYIEDSMTATWFSNTPVGKSTGEVITSELIYYWMIALNIPLECQRWHLSRLLTLIKVCNIKNTPAKKTSRKDYINKQRQLNAERQKIYNTKG